jgi:hypothetical protein
MVAASDRYTRTRFGTFGSVAAIAELLEVFKLGSGPPVVAASSSACGVERRLNKE